MRAIGVVRKEVIGLAGQAPRPVSIDHGDAVGAIPSRLRLDPSQRIQDMERRTPIDEVWLISVQVSQEGACHASHALYALTAESVVERRLAMRSGANRAVETGVVGKAALSTFTPDASRSAVQAIDAEIGKVRILRPECNGFGPVISGTADQPISD